MRPRPIRPNIYRPIERWGVVSTDWKFVLAGSLAGYLIPFFLGLKIGRVPVWLFSWIISTLISYSFFRWVRQGRPPFWIQHQVRARLEGKLRRRSLPGDAYLQQKRLWIK